MMTTTSLQKIGGTAAVLNGLIYILAFIGYGAVLVYPSADADVSQKLQFLSDNYVLLFVLNLFSYVVFGFFLTFLAHALHQRFKTHSPMLSRIALSFGMIWVALVMASGMLSNIGMDYVIQKGTTEPENAWLIWSGIGVVAEALGGGNEVVGGIWMLLVSLISLQSKLFPKTLVFLGFAVGLAGILTIHPLAIFKEAFGITQIFWFLGIGIFMFRNSSI